MLGPKLLRITHDMSPNIGFPGMIRTHLERGICSCATGYDRSNLKRSLGEAIERHLSFSDADQGVTKLSLAGMDPFIREWFIRSFPGEFDEKKINNHAYNMTEVFEASSGKKYLAPLIAFNLGKSADDDFYGFRDSSGSALHLSEDKAILNSRDEFCERQSLSLFWYFGHCLSYMNLAECRSRIKLKEDLPFIDELLKCGDIYVFDISLISPVRTILSIYHSDHNVVKFAAGASGNMDPDLAISKSLSELYQAYILMLNLSDKRSSGLIRVDDPIISGYLSYNSKETRRQFDFFIQNAIPHVNDLPDSVEFIKDFYSEPVLCFHKSIEFSRETVFYTVMKSINGFNSMSLNINSTEKNAQAASHYGYTQQINNGPIPFA